MKYFYLLISIWIPTYCVAQNPADRDPTFNTFSLPENYYTVGSYVKRIAVLPDDKMMVMTSTELVRMNGNYLDSGFSVGTGFTNPSGVATLTDFLVQPDGKIVVLGNFSSYDGHLRKHLVRLNANGSMDPTFSLFFIPIGEFYSPEKIFLQPDGKIVVIANSVLNDGANGGNNNIIRLNTDGSSDLTFNAPDNYLVSAVVGQQDGKLIVAHNTSLDGYGSTFVSRLLPNGSIDTGFVPALFEDYPEKPSILKLMVQQDGKVLVSGSFYKCNSFLRNCLVRLNSNGIIDMGFNPNGGFATSNSIGLERTFITDILEQPDHKLIVCGNFNNSPSFKVKRLNADGSADTDFTTLHNFVNIYMVNSISRFSDGKIIAGGDYDQEYRRYDSYIVKLNTDGTKDTSFNNYNKGFFMDSGPVRDVLQMADGKTLVGGLFHTYNGTECYTFTRLNNDGSIDPSLNYGGLNGFKGSEFTFINKIAVAPDNKIYLGGLFEQYNGQACRGIIRINPDGTTDMTFNSGSGFDSTFAIPGHVKAILPIAGGVLLGGNFKMYNGSSCGGLLALSDTGVKTASYLNNVDVTCIEYLNSGKLLVGHGGGMRRFNVNMTPDNTFQLDPMLISAKVNKFYIQSDQRILIGGQFLSNNDSSKILVRLLIDGLMDNTFNFVCPDSNDKLHDFLLLPNGKILVSIKNEYTKVNRMLRLNYDGSVDLSFAQQHSVSDHSFNFAKADSDKIFLFPITKYQNEQVGGLTRLMGDSVYSVTGEVTIDIDSNDVTQNRPFTDLRLNLSGTEESFLDLIPNSAGLYRLGITEGTYTITPVLENPEYYSIAPTSMQLNAPIQSSPILQNFTVTPVGVHPDLEILMIPLETARPGVNVKYKIIYRNKGNQTQSGTVQLTFDDAMLNSIAHVPVASSQSVNNVSWDFSNLQPQESREIRYTMHLNTPSETPPVTANTLLNINAGITSAQQDETPDDNTFTLKQQVVLVAGSNDKSCLQGTFVTETQVGDFVHYLIRFENTGNYTAKSVRIIDIIDTDKFEITSLQPIHGSHPFSTKIIGARVEFFFENIDLSFDNSTNDGYIAFKIRSKSTLVPGDSFSNSASIHFDYNNEIQTNTFTTTVELPLSSNEPPSHNFVLYPNPVNDLLNLHGMETESPAAISIHSVAGHLIMVIPNVTSSQTIDVSTLSAGIYILKIILEKQIVTRKFLKH